MIGVSANMLCFGVFQHQIMLLLVVLLQYYICGSMMRYVLVIDDFFSVEEEYLKKIVRTADRVKVSHTLNNFFDRTIFRSDKYLYEKFKKSHPPTARFLITILINRQ